LLLHHLDVQHDPEGVFAKYAALVSSASEGAITRPR